MIAYPLRTLAAGAFAATLSASMCLAPAAAAAAFRTPGPGPAAHRLHALTRADLARSMRGEAFANASYTLFSTEAGQRGHASVARLFSRTADVELGEHFTEEAALSGLVGSDAANLAAAAAGEGYESRTMYPSFARQARADGETAAAALFTEIARDEAGHRAAFLAALRALRGGRRAIPAPPAVHPVAVRAGLARVHARRTLANLDTALHGEALAQARYRLFARHAARAGHAAVARLFAASADVELREHFTAEAALAGAVHGTRANLGTAITGERYESRTMYPGFARRAQAVRDAAAARLFRHNAADEAQHARAFAAVRRGLR